MLSPGGLEGPRECGPTVGGLHEWPLPEGLPGLSWRSAGSSYAAFPSPVWQDGGGKVAQDVEGLERIQEASPREESAGLSL